MRFHSLIRVAIVILVILIGLSWGCTGPNVAIGDSQAQTVLIDFLKKVPVFYDFTFWDAKTLRDDSSLSPIYQVWKERKRWESLSINATDVDYLAEANVLTIMKGGFKLDEVRNKLPENYYRDTAYQDVEVWVSKPDKQTTGAGGAIALVDGLFVWGNKFNIDDYIKVMKGEVPSLYDKNTADILERLPVGIMITIRHDTHPEGLLVMGTSYKKEGDDTFRWSNVYKFRSSDDVNKADSYFKKIKDDLIRAETEYAKRQTPAPLRSFTLKQEGQFVEWSVLVNQEYLVSSFFYD